MKLKDVLEICDKFIKSPEDFDVAEAYNNMLQSLTIRAYLPMQEKVIALVRMIIDSDKDIDVEETFFTAGLELACCFDGLLTYANIDTEINIEIKSYENYDLIYRSGLADYILQFCEKDYDRLVRMMERTLSFQNLKELTTSLRELNFGELDKTFKALKDLKNETDPEMLKNLASISAMNDPYLNLLKDKIVSDSVDKAFEDKKEVGEKLKVVEKEG